MNKMNLALIALACAGCATPQDRRINPPNLTLESAKTSKDVAICISDRWQNTKPFMALSSPPVSVLMAKNGYSVAATDINAYGSSSCVTLADITDRNGGSATQYYRQEVGFGDYDEAVKECQ